MIRRPPRSTRTDTLFPYPTLFRSRFALLTLLSLLTPRGFRILHLPKPTPIFPRIFLRLEVLVFPFAAVLLDNPRPAINDHFEQIGRASCRERGCQYVLISVDAASLKKKDKLE